MDGGPGFARSRAGQRPRPIGAFRRLSSFAFTPSRPGTYQVLARARNSVGQTQADKLIFNPAGYHNNVIRPLTISVA